MKVISMMDLADMEYSETPIEEIAEGPIPEGLKGYIEQKYTADLGNGYSIEIYRSKSPNNTTSKWQTEIYFPQEYRPAHWARENSYILSGEFNELSDQIRYTVDKINREAGYGTSGILELQGILRGLIKNKK